MLRSIFEHSDNHYGKVILTPDTLAAIAAAPETMEELLSFHQLLASDEYTKYVDAYYREAVIRFGRHWRYLDISNVLFAASRVLQPQTYLEIGVRRGRSACMVARGCPPVNIVAFDMWVQNYAGMDNPGEEFVRQELIKHGHSGDVFFVNGNSHQTVPAFFKKYPDTYFDMITVDGDHSVEGAFDDLCNVIPHLSVGGVLIFDDISHPAHPDLLGVWRKAMKQFPFLAGYEYTDAGFGVAFAIRKG
jgi:predicted O-methyltransferase YrrM